MGKTSIICTLLLVLIMSYGFSQACTSDEDCDDGLFCNGEESCVKGQCRSGYDPCPDDGLFCNGFEECDEKNDICRQVPSPCVKDDPCNEADDCCAADYGCGQPPLTTTTTIAGLCPSESIYGERSEQTELLRYLRDNVLKQTPEGREIIRLYYQWSPVVVKAMEQDEKFKEEVKEMIDGVLELIGGVE